MLRTGGIQCGEKLFSPRGGQISRDRWSFAQQRGVVSAAAQPSVSGSRPRRQKHQGPSSNRVASFFLCLSPFIIRRRRLLLLHQGHSVPMSSVTGCIRNFKMNEEVLWDAESSYGTLPCFSRLTEKGTYFGGGYIFSGLSTLVHPDASSFLLSNQKSEKQKRLLDA